MKVLKKKVVYKGKYQKVLEREFLTKNGTKGVWEYIERGDAVFIFALTKKKEVILEKIFRIPINSFSIEIPAGRLDKKGEKPEKAAQRELLEETGYLAKKLIPVLKFHIEPTLLPNQAILFFAPDVEFISKKGGEDVEEIKVIKVPLKNLEKFLLKESKKITIDPKILGFAALLKAKKLL